MTFAYPIVGVRFRRFLQASFVLVSILVLQPAVWFPPTMDVNDQFRDYLSPIDLRPGPVDVLERGGLIATDPVWIQSTGQFGYPAGSGALALVGLAPDARIFANGIQLASDGIDGGIQVFPISPDFLQDDRNRYDVIHRERDAFSIQYVSFVRTGNAAWRVQAYARLADTARFLVLVLALGLAAIHLAGFARSTQRRDLGIGLLCLGVGLAGSPQLFVAATNLPDSVGIVVRWLAVFPAIAVLATLRNGPIASAAIRIIAALCFACSFAVQVSHWLTPSLSLWPAVLDSIGVAFALSVFTLIGLSRMDDVVQFAADLARRIRERRSIIAFQEGVIAQQAETLEAEIRKRAVLEERARFARDMHDGLGGNLLSLLVEVRSGEASRERIESAIEHNLDDMRLMIDSLDHADRSLASALSTFQTRIRPMYEASRIVLNWTQPPRAQLPTLSPEVILNLLRVLQESASNIVRHSDADRANFEIGVPPDGGRLDFTISDNGTPSPGKIRDDTRPTSGLRNMKQRVEALKGSFSAGYEDGTGWVVRASIHF